jgi:hypothetical protein
MAAYPLEMEHHIRQVFIADLFPPSLMGDWPVLAEDTTEITIGEKYRSRPILTDYGHLLAKMGMVTEDHRL